MADAADGVGSVVTGALIAHEIARARHDAPAIGHDVHEACANCGTTRQGPYCHGCGQAGHVHRNFGALVHDVAHGVFHFEGKIWRTLPLLAWHPGRLTRRYVAGERAKFVSPMALFLFSIFLLFAVVSNLPGSTPAAADGGGIRSEIAKSKARIAALTAERNAAGDAAAKARIGEAIADATRDLKVQSTLDRAGLGEAASPAAEEPGYKKLDHADVHTGVAWLDDMIIHAAGNPELLLYKMKSYGYKYSWALIPISLPFLWLLFAFRRDVGLYDHAIFAIYSLSFMSLGVVALAVLGAIGLPTAILALAAIFVPPAHMYRQLKGAYRLGRFGAGWRTVALLCISFVTSGLFLAFLFAMGAE